MKYRSRDDEIDTGGRTLCKRSSFSFITIHIRGGDERGKEKEKKKEKIEKKEEWKERKEESKEENRVTKRRKGVRIKLHFNFAAISQRAPRYAKYPAQFTF